MKSKLALMICILLQGTLAAQLDLESIAKQKGGELKDKAKEKLKTKASQALEKQKKEYDESNFNYAICFLDNSGGFEAAERGSALSSNISTLAKYAENEEKTTEEKAYTQLKNGELLLAANKFYMAEQSFKLAKLLYEQDGKNNTLNYAQTLSDMGLLYEIRGRLNKAEPLHKAAYTLRKQMGNKGMLLVSLNNLAVLEKDKGNYPQAEENFKNALVQALELKDKLAQALIHNNLAMTYLDMNRVKEAENQMHSCLSEASTILKPGSGNLIKLQFNLANVYRLQKKYVNAEEIYLKAIEAKEKKLGNHPDLAHLKKGLAQVYFEMGKLKEAEELLLSSCEIYKKKLGENNPASLAAQQELGNYYRYTSQPEKAIQLLTKVNEQKKLLFGEKHPQYTRSLWDLALTQWAAKKNAEAAGSFSIVMRSTLEYINEFFQALNDDEKSQYWTRTQTLLNQYYNFLETQGNENAATMFELVTKTKGFLLNSSSKLRHSILSGSDETLKKTYLQWLECKEQLNQAYQLSKEELAEEHINADSLNERCNELEKELSKKSKLFNSVTPQALKWQDLQKSLKPDEALVEILQVQEYKNGFTGKEFYLAFVVSGSGLKKINLGPGDQIAEAISVFREKVINRQPEEGAYQKTWRPIQEHLRAVRKVYYAPDGAYHQLSVPALKDETGKYLVDKFLLVNLGNSSDIINVKEAEASNKKPVSAVLIGNPLYGQNEVIEQLPGTEAEVKKISKLMLTQKLKPLTLIGEKATEQSIKDVTSPSILHIATHGYFLSDLSEVSSAKVLGVETGSAKNNPLLRSGLLLANCENVFDENYHPKAEKQNGVLTAYEALSLDLDKTDLVILSACQTGLGEVRQGEGVYGLQRSFLIAGARSLVMSLWNVSDDATMFLMSSFYTQFLKSGNKAQAFSDAIKQVKLKYKEPYYWAAFVMLSR